MVRKNGSWFNEDIRRAMSIRDNCYKTWIHFRCPETFEIFKRVRNEVNLMVRRAKQIFMSKHLDTKLPTKQLWSRIRELGIKCNDVEEIHFSPNEINSYFSTLTNNVIGTTGAINISNGSSSNISFSFKAVDAITVHKAITSQKSNAVGTDGVELRYVKIILTYILPFVTHAFNHVLTCSKFPSCWKVAKVVPIPKISRPKTVKDLRPISLLPSLSKAMEKIMRQQIDEFISANHLLTDYQSGFRKNFSTESELLKVCDDLITALDKKHLALLTLLDFSKAFDMVDIDILISKLKTYFNFSSSACNLVQSYMSDRKQCVFVENAASDVSVIKRGVPQGSILGPLLFSLFINDLPKCLLHCQVHMYADDVQIYTHGPRNDLCSTVAKMNLDIENIVSWSKRNGLALNYTKTVSMLFSSSNNEYYRSVAPPIRIGDEIITLSTKARNLGIIMDPQFTWQEHITHLCSKVYASLRSLYATAHFTPQPLRKHLVKTLILPHLSYCCAVHTRIHQRRWIG